MVRRISAWIYHYLIRLFAALVLLIACNALPTASQEGLPGKPPDLADPPNPPRIIWAPPPVNLYGVTGVSAFALAMYDESHMRMYAHYARERGYNTLRVCWETSRWPGEGYLPRGPEPLTDEWEENLNRVLRATRDEGQWIQLVSCTIKSQPIDYQVKVAQRVVSIVEAGGFSHVIWEAVNEWWVHSRLTENDVRRLLLALPHPRGTDAHDLVYPQGLAGYVDYKSFHPARNPRPTRIEIWAAVARYGTPWFEETESYATDLEVREFDLEGNGNIVLRGRGTEEERQAVVASYRRDVEEAGGRWFFHSINGLSCREATGWWSP